MSHPHCCVQPDTSPPDLRADRKPHPNPQALPSNPSVSLLKRCRNVQCVGLEFSGADTVNHQTWRELYRKLRLSTALTRAHSAAVALTALGASPPPSAVLIFDAKVLQSERVLSALSVYTRDGGNVIVCGAVNQDAGPEEYRALFKALRLPFGIGGYYRSTHSLRSTVSSTLPLQPHNLPPTSSVKARTLLNVPDHARLFAPAPGATVQFPTTSPGSKLVKRQQTGMTFAGPSFSAIYQSTAGQMELVSEVGARTVDPAETAVAWLKLGKGNFGFIGDINGEPASIATILVMCGVAHGYAMNVMLAGVTIAPMSINTNDYRRG
ncbi:hypothetical protein P7C70_g8539, partial [Phenoliferia sp. Uapishka_3]